MYKVTIGVKTLLRFYIVKNDTLVGTHIKLGQWLQSSTILMRLASLPG